MRNDLNLTNDWEGCSSNESNKSNEEKVGHPEVGLSLACHLLLHRQALSSSWGRHKLCFTSAI